ncbi:MAG: ATP-binding protein [Nitrospiraceae bacterium]|nr:ATP-binding protein [Nitrospiraceae bacterium]
MVKQIFRKWETINPWHFVWIGMIASEILTTLLSVAVSLALWGNVSNQVLIVGFFDAFVVSLIVVAITVYFVRRTSSLSEINERLHIEITDRKQAEEAIVKSRNSLQAVVDSMDGVVYVADIQTYEVLLINKYVRDMFGDIQGKTCWQTIQKGQTGPCSFCSNSKLVSAEGALLDTYVWEFENTVNQRWYECHDKAIRWMDGRIVRIEIAADITVRKNLEQQLRQSQKMEAVGILAGGVAHEFSNILTTIKGSAYIIMKKLEKNDSLNKYAELITDSINKASNLAQGLLAFSKKQIINLKHQNLNEIVLRVKNLVSNLIGEHIELNIELTDRDPTIIADSNQIEQVLINLVTNARDAMQKGGRLTIKTDIEEMNDTFKKEHGFGVPGKYCSVIVSDTGTGMTESIKEKIFEPFFTTKELGKGTGLGLSIVYGIVNQHNGYIDVISRSNEGTTFKIYLPRVEAKTIYPERPDIYSAIGGTETILLAEDDSDTRETMGEVLRLSGYTVIEARDGEDAVSLFRDRKEGVDLVFLDVRMPKKNGREVYEETRKMNPGTKFLFMSGYTDEIINSQGILEEGFNFISKVALPDEILLKIREVLDKCYFWHYPNPNRALLFRMG